MDCPACKHKYSKVISTTRWPTLDKRKQECLSCGYQFGTIAMLAEDEALLECAALVTRNFYKSRDSYDPKTDRIKGYSDCGNSQP